MGESETQDRYKERDCVPKRKEFPVRTEIVGYEKPPINFHDLTANEERLFSIPQTRQEVPCRVRIIKTEKPNASLYIPEGLQEEY